MNDPYLNIQIPIELNLLSLSQWWMLRWWMQLNNRLLQLQDRHAWELWRRMVRTRLVVALAYWDWLKYLFFSLFVFSQFAFPILSWFFTWKNFTPAFPEKWLAKMSGSCDSRNQFRELLLGSLRMDNFNSAHKNVASYQVDFSHHFCLFSLWS